MKKTMLAMLGVTALALPLSAAAPTWLHVKVDEAGPKATTVRVNLPFTVIEVAAPLANAEWGKNVKIPGTGGLDKARLQAMWTAAKEAGDSEFVRVDSETEHVRVARIGGRLVVQVDNGGKNSEKVRVEIPGDVADALLSGPGDQLNFVAALTALKRAGNSSLVSVDGGKDKVHIWVDDRNVSE
jgi:D-arabinose 1-dehydrogenase-like Zn-dependent alcohol dehydrogenase